MFRLTSIAIASVTLLGAVHPSAPEPETPFNESAEAVLVEVPVRVSDRNGSPIRGLEAKDFEVFDDGKKQEILAVDSIDLARKTLKPGAPAEPLNPAARRHFLLLFDFSFAHPKAILQAQRAAREFVLSGLSDTDFAAVATYSVEHGLKLLMTFSSDRVQLSRAIDTLGLVPTEDLAKDPLSFAFDTARTLPTSTRIGQKESQAAAITETLQTLQQISRARYDQYARLRIRRLTESLGDLASALDSVSGRKDIIYMSEGFESRLVTGTRDTELEREWIISGEQWKVDGDKRFGNTTLQDDIRQVGDLFRRSDCVLHAVDIGGLRLDPENTTVDNPAENSLFELAQPTGGEVLRSSNDFHGQLDRLVANTSLVYVLSFRPTRSGREGKYHALRVKVRVSGARILSRAGYYERPPFRLLSPLERNLVAADVIANETPVSDIPTRMRISPQPDASGLARVPVLIEIPGAALLAHQVGDRLPVEIYVYAHDGSGALRDYFTQTVQVDLGLHRDRLTRGGLRYFGQLALAQGNYRVRALVRNGQNGRMGLAVEDVRVPDFSGKQPYIAPLLFLDSSSPGIFVRGKMGETTKGAADRVTLLPTPGPDLLPAALPEMRSGSPAHISLVAYYFGEPQNDALKIGAQVLTEEGRPLEEGDVRVLERSPSDSDGRQVLMVAFTPERLSPGRYSLRLILRDAATGKGGHASAPFLVR
jgi:VWFA-related protein